MAERTGRLCAVKPRTCARNCPGGGGVAGVGVDSGVVASGDGVAVWVGVFWMAVTCTSRCGVGVADCERVVAGRFCKTPNVGAGGVNVAVKTGLAVLGLFCVPTGADVKVWVVCGWVRNGEDPVCKDGLKRRRFAPICSGRA